MHHRVYNVRVIPLNKAPTRHFLTPSLWMEIGERQVTRIHLKVTQVVGASSATSASSINAATEASMSGKAPGANQRRSSLSLLIWGWGVPSTRTTY